MDSAFALSLFSPIFYKEVTKCQRQRVLVVIFFHFSELFIEVQNIDRKVYTSELCSSANFYKANTPDNQHPDQETEHNR